MPMVWYIPPLSPVVDVVSETGYDAEDAGNLFGAIDELRIPIEYLANLFTAGDIDVVSDVLRKMAAMRSYMRDINLGNEADDSIAHAVGMDGQTMQDMYRLLALAKYDERYVIPAGHSESAHDLEAIGSDCPVNFDEDLGMEDIPGVGGNADKFVGPGDREHLKGRFNLFNWDGKGRPEGLFPPPAEA